MGNYTLYLDESELPEINLKKFFCIGGIIVEDSYHDKELTNQINKSKHAIWNKEKNPEQCILHELEINEAHNKHFSKIEKYNRMFCVESCYKKAYKEIAYIFSDKNITTMAVCLEIESIDKCYKDERIVINNKYVICMQLLIENYCHFLIKNNSTGKICYESLQEKQNDSIRKRYGQIYHSGTMFYPSNVICKYLNKNMEFKDKQDNITGLQIADFVPNDIARYKAGISCKYKSSHKNIRARLYDGEIDRKDRFGNKIIS